MGNITGGRRRKAARIMKIDGETFKLKMPAKASDATKDYPGHVLLESEAVRRFGLRAQPLRPTRELEPKKTYFLVELPKVRAAEPDAASPVPLRRVRSGVQVSAKDRLELLMLSRRSVSDITPGRPASRLGAEGATTTPRGAVRVKVRLPKAQVEKIVKECRDEREMAEKIIGLYAESTRSRQVPWKPRVAGIQGSTYKARERKVSFADEEMEEIRAAM